MSHSIICRRASTAYTLPFSLTSRSNCLYLDITGTRCHWTLLSHLTSCSKTAKASYFPDQSQRLFVRQYNNSPFYNKPEAELDSQISVYTRVKPGNNNTKTPNCRFFTIHSSHHTLSPTWIFIWQQSNNWMSCMSVCLLVLQNSSVLILTECIYWLKTFTNEGREETRAPKENPW